MVTDRHDNGRRLMKVFPRATVRLRDGIRNLQHSAGYCMENLIAEDYHRLYDELDRILTLAQSLRVNLEKLDGGVEV